MANTKISALTSGNPAQAGDIIPIDRAGTNYSITAGSIASIASSASLPLAGGTMTGGIGITSGLVVSWNSDVGISRLGAASIAVGNGAAGDHTGTVSARVFLADTTQSQSGIQWNNPNTAIVYNSGYLRMLNAGNGNGFSLDTNGNSLVGTTVGFAANTLSAADGNISRLGAGSLAIGNGTAGDFSGSIQCSSIALNGAVASPTAGVYYSGTTAGVTQTAEAVGTLATKGGIVTTFTAVSDERLKVHQAYEGGLHEVLCITPIKYRWNETGKAYSGQSTERDFIGFSAQNVHKVIPEATWVSKDGFLGFDDRPVIAALVNAVKELEARLAKLEK